MNNGMTIFKVTKSFQGGQSVFRAVMPRGMRVQTGCWRKQLHDWGENTNGGHNYGWRISAVRVKRFPKVTMTVCGKRPGELTKITRTAGWLKFNPAYLEAK